MTYFKSITLAISLTHFLHCVQIDRDELLTLSALSIYNSKNRHTIGEKKFISLGKIGTTIVYVPGASYKAGISDIELYEHVNKTFSVNTGFWTGETEVTYELWSNVYNWAINNGYNFANHGQPGGDENGCSGSLAMNTQHPVTCINSRDAMVWTNALTEYYNEQNETSLDCVYTTDGSYSNCIKTSTNSYELGSYEIGSEDNPYRNFKAKGFRMLETEEWELAARLNGIKSGLNFMPNSVSYIWTPGDHASGSSNNYKDIEATGKVAAYNASTTSEVKSKNPNYLGLYDMSGNVWEWTSSFHSDFIGFKVLRGGCNSNKARSMQVGIEMNAYPGSNSFSMLSIETGEIIINHLGLRIAKSE